MSTIQQRLAKWFSQPQDIAGLGLFAYTALNSVVQYCTTDSVHLAGLIAGIASSFVLVIVPTGTTLAADIKQLVEDGINAALAKNLSAAAPLLDDGKKIISDLETKGS